MKTGNGSESMATQLARIRSQRYSQIPRQRHVLQSFLPSSMRGEENRQRGMACVLDWANSKWPGLIPRNAYEGNDFDFDQGGLRLSATRNAEGSI